MKRNRSSVAAYAVVFVVAQLAARIQEEIHT
jgi:hypothetical protein